MIEENKFNLYFDQHIGTVFARQLRLSSFLGENTSAQLDLANGTANFGNELTVPIQVLGTQLEKEEAWLWAWSDDNEPPFKQDMLIDAQEIKKTGHQHNIEQFAHDKMVLELSSVPLVPDELNGDYIASIAAGLFNTVYWRKHFDNDKNTGTLYFLIKNPPLKFLAPFQVPEILDTIEEACSYYQMQDKVMVESFLQQQGFTSHWQKNKLIAERGSENIVATFNKKDHCIEEIEAHGFEGEENYRDNDDDPLDDEFPPRI